MKYSSGNQSNYTLKSWSSSINLIRSLRGETQASTSNSYTPSLILLQEQGLATAVLVHGNIFPLTTCSEILDSFLFLFTNSTSVSTLHATIIRDKKGFGHPDLSALPAPFTLLKMCGLLLNKRLQKCDLPHKFVNSVPMPQSLSCPQAQDISLNQHSPVLQAKVIDSELGQLKNGHICFFHSDCLLCLQKAGESNS